MGNPRPSGLLFAILLCASLPRVAAAQGQPLEELLRLHHAHRVAHVTGDAAAFVGTFADTVVQVARGALTHSTREEAHVRFAGYFAGSTFLEWEDVRPPRVSISRDGSLASMHVWKRVRLLRGGEGSAGPESAVRFAWTEVWRRTPEGWRLLSTSSTDAPEPEPYSAELAARVEAARVLRRARDAMGGHDRVARVAMISFDAECEGPRGEFETSVLSARDGRLRFEQRFPARPDFTLGVGLNGGWQRSADGTVTDSLSSVLRSVAYAHEMLLLALAPEARYRAPAAAGIERFGERDADVIRFADPLDAPVEFFYDRSDGKPLGFRVRNHTGRDAADVTVTYDDWRMTDGLRVPFAMALTHGDEIFRYRITRASTGWLPARSFELETR